MKFKPSWILVLLLAGSYPALLWAASKPENTYAVRPSSETAKRREAVLALGQSPDAAQAGPRLIAALKDEDPMTRGLAIQSIGSLKYAAARPELEAHLASDRSPEVREAAALSLRQIEDPQSVIALGKALNDIVVNVRVTALMGLAHYKDAKVRPLVEAACRDKAVEVRRTALYVLSRLEDPAAAPTVRELLKDSDPGVRANAAQTLGELHAKDSIAVIEPLLKDSDKSVQAAAARSLLMMGDAAAFATAKSLVKDPNITVQLLAIDALGWSKDPEAETQLQALLTESPAGSRIAVQEALARTKQLRKR